MNEFAHERHKAPHAGQGARDLVLVCPQFRSNVNFSRIVRAASCCGVGKIVAAGQARIDDRIARGAEREIAIEVRRSLAPAVKRLKDEGFALVGLEQTTHSVCLYEFPFPQKTALVVGHERSGLADDLLVLMEAVVEIPVYGMPHSHNIATATCMALYEYCRQWGSR